MVKVFNPEFKSRIEKFLERQYFMKLVGFELNVIEPGRTEGWLDLTQDHQQQIGLVHGGVVLNQNSSEPNLDFNSLLNVLSTGLNHLSL